MIESAYKPQTQSTSTTDKTVLDRIQKCLDRAYHANTSEAGAKVALFVSRKLMSQHNVSQADLMTSDDAATRDTSVARALCALRRLWIHPKG